MASNFFLLEDCVLFLVFVVYRTFPYELIKYRILIVLTPGTGFSGNFSRNLRIVAAQDFCFHLYVLYRYTSSHNCTLQLYTEHYKLPRFNTNFNTKLLLTTEAKLQYYSLFACVRTSRMRARFSRRPFFRLLLRNGDPESPSALSWFHNIFLLIHRFSGVSRIWL